MNENEYLSIALNRIVGQEVSKVLDEIKSELKDIAFEIDGEHESYMVIDMDDALKIIDKYKAKTEGGEH